jgi:hypothetical protein
MAIRISVTSKLDGIRSWSLEALDTCPASKQADGTLVDACKGCYATTGNYRFPNVKAPRIENKLDWQSLDWTDRMVKLCKAYENIGKCSGCRACYDKSVDVIAYPAHGVKMHKVIKLQLLAA